ncbi:hypothetical protein [Parasphingorhabdus sp.]|uniref:hypothetical protein n=1 Tax=Parasphingorhabdus sp. TaxID=2709688 RepID=UPI0030010202
MTATGWEADIMLGTVINSLLPLGIHASDMSLGTFGRKRANARETSSFNPQCQQAEDSKRRQNAGDLNPVGRTEEAYCPAVDN